MANLIFTYRSGDCGAGYFTSLMLVNLMVFLAFGPLMALMISWLASTRQLTVIVAPFIFQNPYNVPWWLLGFICLVPGFLAAYSRKPATRNTFFNIWVVCLLFFAIWTVMAGAYMVHTVYRDRKLLSDIMKSFIPSGHSKDGWYSKVHELGERVSEIGLWMLAYQAYKVASYPFNAIFFLYWQRGVTIVAFLVIPSVLAFWALFHALGNRNYFATNPPAYKEVTIAEGHSDDEADNGDYDYDSEHSDADPLYDDSMRSYDGTASQVTVVQPQKRNRRTNKNRV